MCTTENAFLVKRISLFAREGLKAEVFGALNPDLRTSAFGPRQSRPARLSQALAIAAEVFMDITG
jgi:hypothetical protein